MAETFFSLAHRWRWAALGFVLTAAATAASLSPTGLGFGPEVRVKLMIAACVAERGHVPNAEDSIVDPWGNECRLARDPRGQIMALRSAGPNGVFEAIGGDDVKVPTTPSSGPLFCYPGPPACGCPVCVLGPAEVLALLLPRALCVAAFGMYLAGLCARTVRTLPAPWEPRLLHSLSGGVAMLAVVAFGSTGFFPYSIVSILYPDASLFRVNVSLFFGAFISASAMIRCVRGGRQTCPG